MKFRVWKDIKGYEGLYQISNDGKVKGLPRQVIRKDGIKGRNLRERPLKGAVNSSGYLTVTLSDNGKSESKFIHRLVAEAFIENESNFEQVNHKDRNKLNNEVTNLEWITPKNNSLHWNKLESDKERNRGESNPNSKLKINDVLKIRELREKGMKIQDIADMFKVHNSVISNICTRKTWTHVFEVDKENPRVEIEEVKT